MKNYMDNGYGWSSILPKIDSENKGSIPIVKINEGNIGAGYLSKELINKMIVEFKRTGQTLTDLYVAPEDAADVREWTDTDIDRGIKLEIFEQSNKGSIWSINIHSKIQLGAFGLCNINGYGSGHGKFLADEDNNFNIYHLDNPNIITKNKEITMLGETQILGFDSNNNKTSVKGSFYDKNLILFRTHELDFFKEDIETAVLDTSMFCIGVIDRSL